MGVAVVILLWSNSNELLVKIALDLFTVTPLEMFCRKLSTLSVISSFIETLGIDSC